MEFIVFRMLSNFSHLLPTKLRACPFRCASCGAFAQPLPITILTQNPLDNFLNSIHAFVLTFWAKCKHWRNNWEESGFSLSPNRMTNFGQKSWHVLSESTCIYKNQDFWNGVQPRHAVVPSPTPFAAIWKAHFFRENFSTGAFASPPSFCKLATMTHSFGTIAHTDWLDIR